MLKLGKCALTAFVVLCYASVAYAEKCSEESTRLLHVKSEQGDLEARLYLANLLLYGDCPEPARERGLNLLISAANSGSAQAQLELGRLMLADATTDEQEASALNVLRQSAENGHPDAQELFGLMTVRSAESDAQRDEGFYWLGSAASQGSARAAMVAFAIYKNGMHGIAEDGCIAALWAEAAHMIAGFEADYSDTIELQCQ